MIRIYKPLIKPRIFSVATLSTKKNNPDDPNNPVDEDVTKESLQWRNAWDQNERHWYSKFKVFGSDNNNTDIIKFLQTPIDLRPSSIKQWWATKQEDTEICMQQYIPERNKILGNDLAAAHFVVHRGGSIKFLQDIEWVKQDENMEYKLPNTYVRDKTVEKIDCSNMNLYYEGLENLRGIQKLQWLSLNNCKHMDDWCMDRITGMCPHLLYLDIRNCKNITDRGIGALYRTTHLETLYVDDVKSNAAFEYTCLLLQELLPKLVIKM